MTKKETTVFDYCDAKVSVYAIDSAYHVNEERELITEIPFFNSDYDGKEQFMLKVQKVVNKLADAYTHFDRLVTIETVFINRYCNES